MKKVRGGKKRYNWKEIKETRGGGERRNVDEEEPEVGREEQEK